MSRWLIAREAQGVQVHLPEAVLGAIRGPLRLWGWQLGPLGVGQGPPGVPALDLRGSKQTRDRALHELRTSWRLWWVSQWYRSDRNDAAAAVLDGVQPDRATVQVLHKVTSRVDGWGLSVMMGGMASPAVDFRLQRGIRVQRCWHCGASVVPSTNHVLWECQAFESARRIPRPASGVAARLGWHPRSSVAEATALVQQIGQIRALEVAARGRLQGWIRCRDGAASALLHEDGELTLAPAGASTN